MSRRPSADRPADALRNWLFGDVLPYWARHGYDRDCGGFHERLDETRQPVAHEGKRAMVQSRQIYVFAQAALLRGMPEAADLARAGYEFLVSHYRHPEGGWRFRVSRDGGAMDDTRDLYTHAFVLFGLAWRYRLDRNEAARTLADETMHFLERALAHPAGGYHEGIDPAGRPTAGSRRQNPHMHLFEALLEWHAASGDAAWLRGAAALARLLAARFCVGGTLREYFTDDLSPAPGAEGRLVEPGHHYEWSWLLHRYRQASSDTRYDALAAALYDFAETQGVDPASGAVIDVMDCHGAPVRRSRRCWPQTEAIKAHIARFEVGDPKAEGRIVDQAAAFLRSHVEGMPAGSWREHIGEDGKPLVTVLPASSLYHITLAATELERLHGSGR